MKSNGSNEVRSFLRMIRRTSHINRMSGVPTIRPYKLSEHMYMTGQIYELAAEKEKMKVSPESVSWVYRHDVPEVLTGDLLYPAKNLNADVKSKWDSIENQVLKNCTVKEAHLLSEEYAKESIFSDEEWELFKECDMAELLLFCTEEVQLGNTNPEVQQVIQLAFGILAKSGFKYIQDITQGCYAVTKGGLGV